MPSPSLVGRDRELDALRALLERARSRTGAAVLLVAEPGGGKTSLARAAAAEAEVAGMAVLWATAAEATASVPLLPLAQAVNNADLEGIRERLLPAHRLAAAVAPALFPDTAPPPIDEAVKPALFESLLAVAVAAGDSRGTFLVVDDAHWADASTRQFIVHAARRAPRLPLVLVVTTRDTEIADLEGASFEVLRPQPLGLAEVALLGARVVGRDPGSDLVGRVAALSAGNPFAAVELFASSARGSLGDSLPAGVRDAVLGRARNLEPQAQAVLDGAAILGMEAEVNEIAGLVQVDATSATAALADLRRRGLVEDAGRGRVRFRHALVLNAVEGEIPAPERESLHARAARLLTAAGAHPARLAHHLAAGGLTAEAVPHAIAAAEQAARKGGHLEAQGLYEAAAGWASDSTTREELLERAANAAVERRDGHAALRLAAAAVSVAEAEGRVPRRARATLSTALNILGRVDDARAEALRAVAELEPGGPSRDLAWALMSVAALEMAQSRPEETLVYAERGLQLADETGDEFTAVVCRGCVAVAHGMLGAHEEGARIIDGLLPAAVAHGTQRAFVAAVNNAAALRLWALRGREALEKMPEFDTAFFGPLVVQRDRIRAMVLAFLGEPQAALESFGRALAEPALVGGPIDTARFAQQRALALVQLDRLGDAEELTRGLRVDPGARTTAARVLIARLVAQRRGREAAAAAAQAVREVGAGDALDLALIDYVAEGLIADGRDAEAARVLLAWPGSDDPWHQVAEARVHRDAALALAAAARFEEAGYPWDEGRARLAAAEHLPPAEAVVQLRRVLENANRHGIALHARIARERLRALGARTDEPTDDDVRDLLERLDEVAEPLRTRVLEVIQALATAGPREAEAAAILRDYYVKKVGSQEVVAERHFLSRPTFYRRLHLGWRLLAERLGPLEK